MSYATGGLIPSDPGPIITVHHGCMLNRHQVTAIRLTIDRGFWPVVEEWRSEKQPEPDESDA